MRIIYLYKTFNNATQVAKSKAKLTQETFTSIEANRSALYILIIMIFLRMVNVVKVNFYKNVLLNSVLVLMKHVVLLKYKQLNSVIKFIIK